MKITKFIYGVCLLSCFTIMMYGQTEPLNPNNAKESCYWANAGAGVSSNNSISLGMEVTCQIGVSELLTISCIYNEEFALFVSPAESIWYVGALYGLFLKRSFGFVSGSLGISMVNGVNRGQSYGGWLFEEYEKVTFNTVGIPIESQLFLRLSPNLGIGINGFANINPEKSFLGVLACIQIGILE
jgi:hypothetical protein